MQKRCVIHVWGVWYSSSRVHCTSVLEEGVSLRHNTHTHTHTRWLPEVQNIFYHGNKRKQIPLGRLEDFFNAAATLMTTLLRELALNSIADYLHTFCPAQVEYVFSLVLLCHAWSSPSPLPLKRIQVGRESYFCNLLL